MCYILGLIWCCLKATFTNLCQSAQNFIHLKDIIDWHQLHAKMQTSGQGNTLLEVSFMCCLKATCLCCFKATCMFYSVLWPSSCWFHVGLRLWTIFNCWRRNLQVKYFHLESKIRFSSRSTFSSRYFVNLDHFTGNSK